MPILFGNAKRCAPTGTSASAVRTSARNCAVRMGSIVSVRETTRRAARRFPASVAERGAATVDDVLHGERREHDAEQALLHRVPGVADHLGDLRRREKTET